MIFCPITLMSAVFMKLTCLLPMPKKKCEDWSLAILRVGWQLSFAFCPWIRVIRDNAGWDQWEVLREKVVQADAEVAAGRAKHKPLFILGNHQTFLDVPVVVVTMPYWVYLKCRTYMADRLFKIPVLSTICRCAGHFPVHFKSDDSGSFKVDAEKMELVEKRVDTFMDNGGWMCMYPEGQMNKNPDELMAFRYGGIKRALERDARIALMVFYGNTKVWHLKALVQGRPGTIRYGVKIVAPDGCQAYVKALRDAGVAEDERDLPDHALLAKNLQAIMQGMYNKYKSEVQASKKTD